MRYSNINGVALALVLCLVTQDALAQTVPSSVDPGQVIQRWRQEEEQTRLPSLTLPQERPSQSVAAGDVSGETFILKDVVLDHATVLTAAEVRDAVVSFLGKETGFTQLEAVAKRLTALYRGRGYILSSVFLAPQEIGEEGVVHFHAVEGRISAVVFEGAVSPSSRMKELAQEIQATAPVKAENVERGLLLMNDLPGVRARAVFRPAPVQTDAAELVILLEKQEAEYALALDNRGSRYLGPWQASGTGVWHNLIGRDNTITARALTSIPADELKYADVTHEQFLGSRGLKLSVHAATSKTRPGGNVSALDIQGDSQTLAARLSLPVWRSRPMNLTGYSGLSLLNTESVLAGVPDGKDRVRVMELGAAFDLTDRLSGKTEIESGLRKGVGFLGATPNGVGRSRLNGERNFTSFYGLVTRMQYLPRGFSAVLAAKGQYALDALLASEEFAVGGADFGRAYDSAEITGDHGAAGSFELRYAPEMTLVGVDDWHLYGFYDGGVVWNRDRVALDPVQESVISAGGGLRLALRGGAEAQFEAATPLTRTVAAGGGKNDVRFFMKLAHHFSK